MTKSDIFCALHDEIIHRIIDQTTRGHIQWARPYILQRWYVGRTHDGVIYFFALEEGTRFVYHRWEGDKHLVIRRTEDRVLVGPPYVPLEIAILDHICTPCPTSIKTYYSLKELQELCERLQLPDL